MTKKNSKSIFDTLKAAELSLAERTAGVSVGSLEDPNLPKVDLYIALAWVVYKRSNPTVTFKDFGNQYTLTEVMEVLGLESDDDSEEK